MGYSKDFLKKFYHYEGVRESHHQRNVYSRPWAKRRMGRVKEICLPFVKRAKCLDLGSAEGLYATWMADNGAQLVVAYDLSRPKLERAEKRPNLIVMQGDWDDLPFVGQNFHLTLLSECLEHSLDPQRLVDNVMAVTMRIVATVPIRETLSENPFIPRPDGLPPSGHIHAFRKDSFLALFEKYNVEHYEEDEIYGYAVIRICNK